MKKYFCNIIYHLIEIPEAVINFFAALFGIGRLLDTSSDFWFYSMNDVTVYDKTQETMHKLVAKLKSDARKINDEV